jgi:hypothetical protein
MSGVALWTTDIGGYHGGNPDDPIFKDLIVRWFQVRRGSGSCVLVCSGGVCAGGVRSYDVCRRRRCAFMMVEADVGVWYSYSYTTLFGNSLARSDSGCVHYMVDTPLSINRLIANSFLLTHLLPRDKMLLTWFVLPSAWRVLTHCELIPCARSCFLHGFIFISQ